MTELLTKALEAVNRLPAEEQDRIARMILSMSGQEEPERIDPEHLDAVLKGLDQAKRREFISDQRVEAAFRRFDP